MMICADCAAPFAARPGRPARRCPACRPSRKAEASTLSRLRRLEAGLCLSCGGPAAPGSSFCATDRAARNETAAAKRRLRPPAPPLLDADAYAELVLRQLAARRRNFLRRRHDEAWIAPPTLFLVPLQPAAYDPHGHAAGPDQHPAQPARKAIGRPLLRAAVVE